MCDELRKCESCGEYVYGLCPRTSCDAANELYLNNQRIAELEAQVAEKDHIIEALQVNGRIIIDLNDWLDSFEYENDEMTVAMVRNRLRSISTFRNVQAGCNGVVTAQAKAKEPTP